jgi:hypothetical protein
MPTCTTGAMFAHARGLAFQQAPHFVRVRKLDKQIDRWMVVLHTDDVVALVHCLFVEVVGHSRVRYWGTHQMNGVSGHQMFPQAAHAHLHDRCHVRSRLPRSILRCGSIGGTSFIWFNTCVR